MLPSEIATFERLFTRFIEEKLGDTPFFYGIAYNLMYAFIGWLDE